MSSHKRGGIVLRVDQALYFVPASAALRIAPAPRVTLVPGGPPDLVGIAMLEGTIVPVVSIGPARAEMVVCQHAGEPVGLIGAEVVRTGVFEVSEGRPEAVVHEGQSVRPLDVATIYARVQAGARPARWGERGA
jgi:chemotaxis signal transduction protein